ncbi:MAG: nucleotidyltransferase domain-containing protein [bacterium]
MLKRGEAIFPTDPEAAKRLDDIVGLILNAYPKTEKIILFGGYARGEYDLSLSEIDVLVITETEEKFMKRIRNFRELCSGRPPVNPIVYTPAEYRALLKEGEGFLEEALEEGKMVFEK